MTSQLGKVGVLVRGLQEGFDDFCCELWLQSPNAGLADALVYAQGSIKHLLQHFAIPIVEEFLVISTILIQGS